MVIDLATINLAGTGIKLAGIRLGSFFGKEGWGAEYLDTDFNEDFRIEASTE